MLKHVNFEYSIMFEVFTTLLTLVGPFTSVDPAMRAQPITGRKAFTTKLTNKWFYTSVDSHVSIEKRIEAKSLVANKAFKWFFITVTHLNMFSETCFLRKSFATFMADIGPLTCMSSDMATKSLIFCKRTVT